jgi:predicted transcriptional regulator
LNPSAVLCTARQRARLSQRALASLARTSQSVVARIEAGETDPSVGTLNRLLDRAGFALEARVVALHVDPQLLDDVERILRLTPEQRLIEVRNVSRFTQAARKI